MLEKLENDKAKLQKLKREPSSVIFGSEGDTAFKKTITNLANCEKHF